MDIRLIKLLDDIELAACLQVLLAEAKKRQLLSVGYSKVSQSMVKYVASTAYNRKVKEL